MPLIPFLDKVTQNGKVIIPPGTGFWSISKWGCCLPEGNAGITIHQEGNTGKFRAASSFQIIVCFLSIIYRHLGSWSLPAGRLGVFLDTQTRVGNFRRRTVYTLPESGFWRPARNRFLAILALNSPETE